MGSEWHQVEFVVPPLGGVRLGTYWRIGVLVGLLLALPPQIRVEGEDADRQLENSLGMIFHQVPAGSYRVGPPNLNRDEAPRVTGNPAAGMTAQLKKPFFLCIHEVRVRDYRAFVKDTKRAEPEGEIYTPKNFRWKAGLKPLSDETWGKPDLPITCVSYDDAIAFCEWLSKKEGRTYRLPTEVEWEYAARAGSNKRYQWENQLYPTKVNGALATDRPIKANPSDEYADAEAGLDEAEDEDDEDGMGEMVGGGGASPTNQNYPPNAWGFYHMLGNVQEFVVMTKRPPKSDVPFPCWAELPGKVNRMLRGGSWVHAACDDTVYQANFNCPPYSNCSIGFRVLLEAEE